MTTSTCPICSNFAKNPGGGSVWECPRCGDFICERKLAIPAASAYKVSALIRADDSQPCINERFVDAALGQPDKSIHEKLRLLLQHIDKNSCFFGESIRIHWHDYPLVYAKNFHELSAMATVLSEQGFIRYIGEQEVEHPDEEPDWRSYSITVNGVKTLDEWRRARPDAHTAFVAMCFDESMKAAYDAYIAPAISDAGYDPVRIDLKPHNRDIVAEIMAEIRMAKFIVADFTEHRSGVYFEAGFAMGLGLEVIWMCREDHISKAHFDISHFSHIVWIADTLRAQLKHRILAVIGPGPKFRGAISTSEPT